ncbi:GNAT family N-acetyltransferase [Bacillus sp. 2205SS5-2]|uniref:GNAT family N-acetyltransferase n=1 Tax=Bacillus sp. 2205SS5-2 TaxID=3109031 RepID=UPI0030073669
MNVRLVKPTLELQTEYFDFYQEWVKSGEVMVPWVISKDPRGFAKMIQTLQNASLGSNLPDGWVPNSTFWLVSEQNRILGAVNIRHSLTEWLTNRSGHIGYGIRPTERQKGYATKLLSLSLIQAKKLGIEPVLVICDRTNIGSMKTILHNNGIEDSDFVEEDGNILKRYWITQTQ